MELVAAIRCYGLKKKAVRELMESDVALKQLVSESSQIVCSVNKRHDVYYSAKFCSDCGAPTQTDTNVEVTGEDLAEYFSDNYQKILAVFDDYDGGVLTLSSRAGVFCDDYNQKKILKKVQQLIERMENQTHLIETLKKLFRKVEVGFEVVY